MDKVTAESRLRRVSGAFLIAGALPAAILIPLLPVTFLFAIPGWIAYVNIFRKWRGHEGYRESATGWALAIAVNIMWLVLCGVGTSRRGLDVFVLVMSTICLGVAIVGVRAQRTYDLASPA